MLLLLVRTAIVEILKLFQLEINYVLFGLGLKRPEFCHDNRQLKMRFIQHSTHLFVSTFKHISFQ